MKAKASRYRSRQRGIAIITTTLALFLIVPMVGLAIDLTMLYLVKAKLLASADAAVLAGARALSQGSDAASQRAAAQAAAAKFFNANWPAGYWGTSDLSFPTPIVDDTSMPNYRSITVSASVRAPLMFLRVLGGDRSTVVVGAQAGRRDALVILVLDRSISMSDNIVPGTGRTACAIMRDDAIEFVKYFAQGRDMLGLVTFNSAQFTYQARTNFNTLDASGKSINTLIPQIVCNSNTAAAEALHAAYAEITRVNSSTRANVVVFMTDGIPNGVTGDFRPYRLGNCGKNDPSPQMVGVLAQWANNQAVGDTAGLMKRTATSVTDDSSASVEGTNKCLFLGDLKLVDSDVSRMPANDVYGNALAGPYSTYSNPYVPFFGSAANLTRVDRPQEITKASANAADNQATVIRSHPTLKPMIYTIGLITNPTGDKPDEQLLMKISNDPGLASAPGAGPTFYAQQQTQPRGIYVNAPDATQLRSAFDTIATHIVVRLSR
jgi:Flp pilus assembly protein TadG